MSEPDVRWIQRYKHFAQAFIQLDRAIDLSKQRPLTELENLGIVKIFNNAYELAWNTIRNYYEAQGEVEIYGSRNAFRLAFKKGLIENDKIWEEMLKNKIFVAQAYNEAVIEEISTAILDRYYSEFVALRRALKAKFKEFNNNVT
jgi:nucleotidyltransferase substrate binding protein (TIGR01987 family)